LWRARQQLAERLAPLLRRGPGAATRFELALGELS